MPTWREQSPAVLPPLPSLPNKSYSALIAETSNGVAAVAVATNSCSNDNSNDCSEYDIPGGKLANQAVSDAQQAAAMNRDWNIEEDADSSGARTKSVSKEMKISNDENPKGKKKTNQAKLCFERDENIQG